MTALAGNGDLRAREVLRDYVRDGIRWIEALESLCYEWPLDWWDDLWEIAAARIDAEHACLLLPDSQPWQRWRDRDRWLDTVLGAADRDRPRPRICRTDLAAASDDELVGHLLAPDADRGSIAAVLWHIGRRGHPVPQLLDVVEQLAPAGHQACSGPCARRARCSSHWPGPGPPIPTIRSSLAPRICLRSTATSGTSRYCSPRSTGLPTRGAATTP